MSDVFYVACNLPDGASHAGARGHAAVSEICQLPCTKVRYAHADATLTLCLTHIHTTHTHTNSQGRPRETQSISVALSLVDVCLDVVATTHGDVPGTLRAVRRGGTIW